MQADQIQIFLAAGGALEYAVGGAASALILEDTDFSDNFADVGQSIPNDGGNSETRGGAISITGSPALVVANCAFKRNACISPASGQAIGSALGGAISYRVPPAGDRGALTNRSITITHSIFDANEIDTPETTDTLGNLAAGGAIAFMFDSRARFEEIRLSNCSFHNNSIYQMNSDAKGAALHLAANFLQLHLGMRIENCDFASNQISVFPGSQIWYPRASAHGGALSFTFSTTNRAQIFVSGSRFRRNTLLGPVFAVQYASGGAISITVATSIDQSLASLIIDDCTFSDNSGGGLPAQGGALAVTGAVACNVSNSEFSANKILCGGASTRAESGGKCEGGAIYVLVFDSFHVKNCSFLGNSIRDLNYGICLPAYGGAISLSGGKTFISHSYFEGNTVVCTSNSLSLAFGSRPGFFSGLVQLGLPLAVLLVFRHQEYW